MNKIVLILLFGINFDLYASSTYFLSPDSNHLVPKSVSHEETKLILAAKHFLNEFAILKKKEVSEISTEESYALAEDQQWLIHRLETQQKREFSSELQFFF